MEKVIVIIERGKDGTYTAYLGDNNLSYSLLGDGSTPEEAINDFFNSYKEMKEYYKEAGKVFIEAEFDIRYDLASFLAKYSDKLSLAGLERITGINQGQLSHYITGRRKPGKNTKEKIEEALHKFGNEISRIHFI